MNFSYNENQKMIADMVQKFGRQHITPYVREWDDNQIFPVEVFKKLGDLGLMGVLVPAEVWWKWFLLHRICNCIQELSILDPSIELVYGFTIHYVLVIFYNLEMRNQKKVVKKLATAEWIGAWGLTEHNTGSDAWRNGDNSLLKMESIGF